jgi:hypothetical protein
VPVNGRQNLRARCSDVLVKAARTRVLRNFCAQIFLEKNRVSAIARRVGARGNRIATF